jgi:hypothetical protein
MCFGLRRFDWSPGTPAIGSIYILGKEIYKEGQNPGVLAHY